MITRKARLLIACLCVSIGGSVTAQPRDDRTFSSVWLIQPGDEALGSRSVRDGEFVFKRKLLPPSLVRLTANAVDAETDKVLVPAGTQLFGVLSAGPPIFCQVGIRDASLARSLLIGGGNRQQCFTDMDRNGALDGHFSFGNAIKGLPNIQGKRPKVPEKVLGGEYQVVPTDQLAHDYFVGVKYEGVIGLARKVQTPVFSVEFGTTGSTEKLSRQIRPVKDSKPFLVSVLGAEFAVTGRKDDVIDIDVRRPIPPQPFGVVKTATYRYY